MKLRIIANGIYGANGEYPIGHEFETTAEIPSGWTNKVLVIDEPVKPAAKAVVNPKGE